jgi:hypothetical protein
MLETEVHEAASYARLDPGGGRAEPAAPAG